MGSRRKRVSFEDETEHTERRRSSRIIALEEKKKQEERDRKLTLELARKNNSDNNYKEKGKAIFDHSKRRIRQPRTSKPAGRNNATDSAVSETQKRDMYWPSTNNKSLLSEFLDAMRPDIQLSMDANKYKDSLLRFVKDLGPTAQQIAAKKLESLRLQQTLNRPLTIPGIGAQVNRNVNTIACGDINMRNDAYNKGKQIQSDESWNARAAAILANFFLNNNDKRGSLSGRRIESSNNARGSSSIDFGMWNRNTSAYKSSNNVLTRVYPTRVISGPQLKPMESMISNNFSGPSFIPQQRHNFSELSLVSHPRPENSMSCMPSNNLRELSLLHQPMNFISCNSPSSGLPLLPSQGANFSDQPDTTFFDLNTPYQPGDFKAIMDSTSFNNSSFPMQGSNEQVLHHQDTPYNPPETFDFPDLQMQDSQLNPLTPFPPEIPQSSAMNYYGGGALRWPFQMP